MRNLELWKEYTKVTFIESNSETISYYFDANLHHEIVNTKKGKMFRIALNNKNIVNFRKAFNITCTLKWIYIPMEYIKEIKENVIL